MNIRLDEAKSIVYVQPTAKLTAEDFLKLSDIVDGCIRQHGLLKGLVIEAVKFPGWENFDAFKAHVKFAKNHQAKIRKVALVTDSKFAPFGEKIIGPFVAAKIKHFPYGETALAEQWLSQ